jgi:hypothetical protein
LQPGSILRKPTGATVIQKKTRLRETNSHCVEPSYFGQTIIQEAAC